MWSSPCCGPISTRRPDLVPSKPASSCPKHGCIGLVRNGVCSVCGQQRKHKDKQYDQRRGSAHARGYDKRWEKLRGMILRNAPFCVDCEAVGRVTPATEVHHIVAKRDGGTDEESNLSALCKSCHSKRTSRGGGIKISGAKGWGTDVGTFREK